ncbi:TIGR04283 family arsenosugar biosynthesis glycosyltransferase [Aquimarina sp. ERC-38]|uniref:TIGR04283 family arsenosugar biosynthesis glycosyltransferase n=1 Tax=Aquimarina sp. ERC-38 TaxID=2949996 RepID=UPI002247A735|nr:TIGR04283 family arsenosugar biosynthesis glycosyltransferase [Aquimarina sp. ERC-38]UZO81245.1 TIGR04283 family arsenosugar biosynthesis glycosyltransferase [Aquimarina sp. ERC-38]
MISIIVPVYNESKTIGVFLDHLFSHSSDALITEILIVDGKSSDGTVYAISNYIQSKKHSGCCCRKIKISQSEKGRAIQQNHGASIAEGEILYFLHSDSYPPKYFDQYILAEIKKGVNAGCFRMQFDDTHWWLQFIAWFTRFDSKYCRGGDQSLFITKSLFEDVRGFDEAYKIYEDNEFISRLYKEDAFCVIPKIIKTSARKYREHGIWTLQYHFFLIHLKKTLGASPEALYRYYLKYIAK